MPVIASTVLGGDGSDCAGCSSGRLVLPGGCVSCNGAELGKCWGGFCCTTRLWEPVLG